MELYVFMQSKGLEWDIVFIVKVYITLSGFLCRVVGSYGPSIIWNTFL